MQSLVPHRNLDVGMKVSCAFSIHSRLYKMASPPREGRGEDIACVAPYSYKPLSPTRHTRILRLEAAADDSAPLRCSLHDIDLDDDLDYDAISYTWGAPDFTDNLFVVASDGSPISCLRITVNLRRGLERLRRTTGARNLWVDAICIDQTDKGDKARQIPRMVAIYRQASSVVVWLGDWEEQAACLARLSWAARRSPSSIDWERTWSDCAKVYSLPWFSRRWVVQEVREQCVPRYSCRVLMLTVGSAQRPGHSTLRRR